MVLKHRRAVKHTSKNSAISIAFHPLNLFNPWLEMRTHQYLFPEGSQFGCRQSGATRIEPAACLKEFPGPLSIKSVIRGEGTWIVNGRELVVDSTSFAVSYRWSSVFEGY